MNKVIEVLKQNIKIIILILAIFETNYLSNLQQRVLDLMNK